MAVASGCNDQPCRRKTRARIAIETPELQAQDELKRPSKSQVPLLDAPPAERIIVDPVSFFTVLPHAYPRHGLEYRDLNIDVGHRPLAYIIRRISGNTAGLFTSGVNSNGGLERG